MWSGFRPRYLDQHSGLREAPEAPRPVEARRLYRGRPHKADLRHSSHSCPPRSVSHATGDAARSRAVELPDSTRSACRTLRNQGDNPSLARCESLVLTVLTIVVRRNPTQIRYNVAVTTVSFSFGHPSGTSDCFSPWPPSAARSTCSSPTTPSRWRGRSCHCQRSQS